MKQAIIILLDACDLGSSSDAASLSLVIIALHKGLIITTNLRWKCLPKSNNRLLFQPENWMCSNQRKPPIDQQWAGEMKRRWRFRKKTAKWHRREGAYGLIRLYIYFFQSCKGKTPSSWLKVAMTSPRRCFCQPKTDLWTPLFLIAHKNTFTAFEQGCDRIKHAYSFDSLHADDGMCWNNLGYRTELDETPNSTLLIHLSDVKETENAVFWSQYLITIHFPQPSITTTETHCTFEKQVLWTVW